MSIDQTLNLEAAKLLKEWSSWMVAVQSALIVAFAKTSDNTASPAMLPISVKIAIACFVVSILCAAWVLSALPYVVIRLSEEEAPNLYLLPLSSNLLLKHVQVWLMAAIQHWGFGLGIISLLMGQLLANSK